MEQLKIYVDRLKEGHQELLNEVLSPSFFDIEDKDLHFSGDVHVEGEVYLANEHLVVHLNIDVNAVLPCAICNELTNHPISIKNLYLTKPLAEIKGAVYDLSNEVRESILLQTPRFTECNQGKCPERESIKKYLAPKEQKALDTKAKGEVVHFPFADI